MIKVLSVVIYLPMFRFFQLFHHREYASIIAGPYRFFQEAW
jgi:hypothetical protein